MTILRDVLKTVTAASAGGRSSTIVRNGASSGFSGRDAHSLP